MVAALDQPVSAMIKELRLHGADSAMRRDLPKDKLTMLLRDIYETVGSFYATKTMREIQADAEQKAGFGINQALINIILEYLLTNLLKDVAGIIQTIKNQIFTIIKQGLAEGWGVDRMAYQIEQEDIPLTRARMIIRTELVKAMNAGQQAGKQESAFESVDQWVSGDDERVRPGHVAINDFKVREHELFPVPKRDGGYDMMTGPGDPTASAGNVINCRCAKVSRVARDENGRPIRKRKISLTLPA